MSETKQLPEKYLKGGRLNPEYAKLFEPYLDEGMPYKAVAEVFSVSRNTVSRLYPGRGWTMGQARELGTFMKHHNQKMRKNP